MQNNLFPVGFVGEKRKPAYLKTQIINHLMNLNVDVETVYNDKWVENETIIVIDDEGCEFVQKQNETDKWVEQWMLELNNYMK